MSLLTWLQDFHAYSPHICIKLSVCCVLIISGFIYHLYSNDQPIYMCSPGFTPSLLICTFTVVWYNCEHRPYSPDVYPGQTCGVMNEASQVHSFYISALFTYQLQENFLPTKLFTFSHCSWNNTYLGFSVLPFEG